MDVLDADFGTGTALLLHNVSELLDVFRLYSRVLQALQGKPRTKVWRLRTELDENRNRWHGGAAELERDGDSSGLPAGNS